jgi:hypothetical protein
LSPMTSCLDTMCLIESRLRCPSLLCQRDKSRGRVEEAKTVSTGFVVPSRYALLLSSMDAVKSVSPLRFSSDLHNETSLSCQEENR